MPFLKPLKEFSRTRQIENLAARNGWHATYFGLDGSTYVGEWKDNKKSGTYWLFRIVVCVYTLIIGTPV